MQIQKFSLICPRKGSCLSVDGQMVYTKIFEDPNHGDYHWGTTISAVGDKTGKKYQQILYTTQEHCIKENIIKKINSPVYKNIQQVSYDGTFTSTKLIGSEVVKRTIYTPQKPVVLTGIKKLVEKSLWTLVNNKNGLEKTNCPNLLKFSGKIIKKLVKM